VIGFHLTDFCVNQNTISLSRPAQLGANLFYIQAFKRVGYIMTVSYDSDIIAWANEQASFLRTGRFDLLDIEHIADEIEDVARAEEREFLKIISYLMGRLLLWQRRDGLRCEHWTRIIRDARKKVFLQVKNTPTFQSYMNDSDFMSDAWSEMLIEMYLVIGQTDIPETCPWSKDEIFGDWFPN
jgi:hypothetical protein